MIVVNCVQGSAEWLAARSCIPTASSFGRILTPTGKASTQATAYMHRLLAEWLSGEPEYEPTNYWMERGSALEAEARAWYAVTEGTTPEEVGFVYLDAARLVGCSPDGLVGKNGGLEIKCPAGATHIEYLLDPQLPNVYKPQVQGCLWITGRKWWDFVSYHPDLPSEAIRVERDEEYIEALAAAVGAFVDEMMLRREQLEARGFAPARRELCAV